MAPAGTIGDGIRIEEDFGHNWFQEKN